MDDDDPVLISTSRPIVDIDELRQLGYLQEVNRRFFHPLGLALAYLPDHDDALVVLDDRGTPEGWTFLPTMLGPESHARAAHIDAEIAARADARRRVVGDVIQPLEPVPLPEERPQ